MEENMRHKMSENENVRLYYDNLTPSENIKRAKSPAIDHSKSV